MLDLLAVRSKVSVKTRYRVRLNVMYKHLKQNDTHKSACCAEINIQQSLAAVVSGVHGKVHIRQVISDLSCLNVCFVGPEKGSDLSDARLS